MIRVNILSRPIGQKLSENVAQPVVIDNRAGANGIIGSDAVAKAPADGYTITIDNVTGHAISATLYSKLPFNSLRDRLLSLAYDLQSSTPQEFSALLKSETEKWAKVVKASGAKAD